MHSKMFNCSSVLRDNFQSAKIKDWCREYQKALDIFKILQDHAIQLLYSVFDYINYIMLVIPKSPPTRRELE